MAAGAEGETEALEQVDMSEVAVSLFPYLWMSGIAVFFSIMFLVVCNQRDRLQERVDELQAEVSCLRRRRKRAADRLRKVSVN